MTPAVRVVYLGLGSNLGDRLGTLQAAVDALARSPGVRLVAVSGVYETDPVGGPEQPDYLNAVVGVETDRSPRSLLELAHDVEAGARRVRAERWGPRTLDVDVLLVGDETVADPDLVVPHPRLHERAFVLAPLADLLVGRDRPWPAAVRAEELAEPRGGWPGVRRSRLALSVPPA